MFHVVNIKALVLKIIDEINAYLLTSRASMINDHDLVVSTPLGKFPEQPLLSAPLFLEQIYGCPLLTPSGHYFFDINISNLLGMLIRF